MPTHGFFRRHDRQIGFIAIIGLFVGAYALNRRNGGPGTTARPASAHPTPSIDLDLSIEASIVAADVVGTTVTLLERRKGDAAVKRVERNDSTTPIGEPAYRALSKPILPLGIEGRCPPRRTAPLKLPPSTCSAIQGRGPALIAAQRLDGRMDIFVGQTVVRTVQEVLGMGYLNDIVDLPEPPLGFVAWKEKGDIEVEINREPMAWECPSSQEAPPLVPDQEDATAAILSVMADNAENGESSAKIHTIGKGRACSRHREIGLTLHIRKSGTTVAIVDVRTGEVLSKKGLPQAFHLHRTPGPWNTPRLGFPGGDGCPRPRTIGVFSLTGSSLLDSDPSR